MLCILKDKVERSSAESLCLEFVLGCGESGVIIYGNLVGT